MKHSQSHAGLLERMRAMLDAPLPLPAEGQTALRHQRLMQVGREDLSLARLAEAHWDAVAILAEAGREAVPGAVYGVWAAEIPGRALRLERGANGLSILGRKRFCSGAGLVDRALITVQGPEHRLVEIDLRAAGGSVQFDVSGWKTEAFKLTNTASAEFSGVPVAEGDFVGGVEWYLSRPGFWHGACGPASCWAGGAAALVDWAGEQGRDDAHTMAHLGAMRASVWAMKTWLETAGREIDAAPAGDREAQMRALMVRHLVEQAASDVLRRLARAYGPHPLAFEEGVGRHYQELDLYLRQSHAERDLEALGRIAAESVGRTV